MKLGRQLLRADGGDRCDDRHGHHQGGDFGPVAPLSRFKSENEAIKMANDTPTLTLPRLRGREDIGRIWRVAETLEYGIIGINEASSRPNPLARSRMGGIDR
jgi:succinate-semialdehyde dehydrogenase/glutarate-semialdehyde dehydrogenase